MRKKLSAILKTSKVKGFTLIELLVVLGILGILAIAILAAINPIEQLNKAQDASQQNATTTFVSAVTQYYSVHNMVPFGKLVGSAGCSANDRFTPVKLTTLTKCVTSLQTEGELKQSFSNINQANQANIFISSTYVNGTYTVFACFKPQSRAVQANPNTKYTSAGAATCTPKIGSACYWCAQ